MLKCDDTHRHKNTVSPQNMTRPCIISTSSRLKQDVKQNPVKCVTLTWCQMKLPGTCKPLIYTNERQVWTLNERNVVNTALCDWIKNPALSHWPGNPQADN